MIEILLDIMEANDISLVHAVSSLSLRFCLAAARLEILRHLFTLIIDMPRSRRRISPLKRIQSKIGPVTYLPHDSCGLNDNRYSFEYIKQNGEWRAYILRMPSLGNREASGSITHRLYDDGRPYVCWDRPVTNLKDIKAISHVWADNIQKYIATGERFG